jgi:hypothetical protein
MRVNKNFGGKRKGYKGKKQSWYHPNQLLNPFAMGKGWGRRGMDLASYILTIPGVFKDGGRVRGVGKATHGYGRAMRKRK